MIVTNYSNKMLYNKVFFGTNFKWFVEDFTQRVTNAKMQGSLV